MAHLLYTKSGGSYAWVRWDGNAPAGTRHLQRRRVTCALACGTHRTLLNTGSGQAGGSYTRAMAKGGARMEHSPSHTHTCLIASPLGVWCFLPLNLFSQESDRC